MTRQALKEQAARIVAGSTAVRDFCMENFGFGALVIVDWYGAEGAPSEQDCPYILLYSTGESSTGAVEEETFTFTLEIGAVERLVRAAEQVRTETTNGLIINGCAGKLEELRTLCVDEIKAALDAPIRSVSLTESSSLDYPLEWTAARFEVYSPRSITL